ncbi:MAG: VOC family protein [Oceanospirillaceae bacterium]
MSIIDHLSVGVSNIDLAGRFYDGLLATIDCLPKVKHEKFIAYGEKGVELLVMLPNNGKQSTAGNGTHIALVAPSQQSVDDFHAFAIAEGGQCAGEPGPRLDYPIPNVYTAYVLDPFGNKLEIIHNGFLNLGRKS